MPDNNKRAERQQKLPIQVIVGNPPWSAGQRSSKQTTIPNIEYPELEQIESVILMLSIQQQNQSENLYDTYKMAIRWASDRIGETRHRIAFVTSGSWIDGHALIREYEHA